MDGMELGTIAVYSSWALSCRNAWSHGSFYGIILWGHQESVRQHSDLDQHYPNITHPPPPLVALLYIIIHNIKIQIIKRTCLLCLINEHCMGSCIWGNRYNMLFDFDTITFSSLLCACPYALYATPVYTNCQLLFPFLTARVLLSSIHIRSYYSSYFYWLPSPHTRYLHCSLLYDTSE